MLNFFRDLFFKPQDGKLDEDYWRMKKGTKIIYQRDGRHWHWDGAKEKEISLQMRDEKEE
jgi:hypothetical protein|tara:strand:+ start:5572 stop:5751 length:180 start_codon:yes stop_codon:yes gene_type:complete